MKKILLIILCFFVYATSFAQVNSAEIDKLMEAFMQKWDLPGGSFAMALNGKILYSKGYGHSDVDKKEPVTTKSLFRIASCSKPFTAVSIMKLVQDGKLNLNDKVFGEKGILDQPQYQNIKDKRVLEITVTNLLEHTGGWDSDIEGDPMFMSVQIAKAEDVKPPAMQEAIVEYVLSKMMLNHPPGTVYAYSNFGFCVLGRVIEKVTGMTYENYVRENVLTPSGSTTMQLGKNLENERFPNEVTYYGTKGEMTTTSVYGNNQTVPWPYGGFNIEAMDSHGEWIASAEDLVNFMTTVGEYKIINQDSYKTMITPPDIKDDSYAKGWVVNNGTIFHTGSLPGTATEIVKATNGYTWALLFNKRSLNNDIWNDLDKLGWTIQPYVK